MASVRVAVRVRPMSKREEDLSSKCIIHTEGKKTSISNPKFHKGFSGNSLQKNTKTFSFDFSYDSTNCKSANYVSQEKIFKDLGSDILLAAFQGYNACIFAYGQTGSGKSFTMMGSPEDRGLIPRICEGMFARIARMTLWDEASFCTKVSYLEIYNERIRDLLRKNSSHAYNLRVREHPKGGPYVEDLSKHLVQTYSDVEELMEKGKAKRTMATTAMNSVSSRSHTIFTINFTQAKFGAEMPCETVSKIHLVDLAGSERAHVSGSSGVRLKEGGSINKSLTTLGNVISALADHSEKASTNVKKRHVFVHYRDSVLTWLLKDSLGGNSKTIMIANVNYRETLSTLCYANRAKNIVNKPTVNEDPNVKLLRELRAEVARLKELLAQGTQVSCLDSPTALSMEKKLHENEARVLELTEEWANKWSETQNILKEEAVALRKEGIAVILDSQLPHLIGIDDDLLSTGIFLYYLKEGGTCAGREDAKVEQDIILHGPGLESEHCVFENRNDSVTLVPFGGSQCLVNGIQVVEPYQLSQGAVILLGRMNMFRFNNPKEAAKLREKRKRASLSTLSSSMTDVSKSSENLSTLMLYNSGRATEEMKGKQRCEKTELESIQQELETQHRMSVQTWLCVQQQNLASQLHHLLAKMDCFEEKRRLADREEEQEQQHLQLACQMAKTCQELEDLKKQWDEWAITVEVEGTQLAVEEKLDLLDKLCEKYLMVNVLMKFCMHWLGRNKTLQVFREVIFKTYTGYHHVHICSAKMNFKAVHMEKFKDVGIENVDMDISTNHKSCKSKLLVCKETLESRALSTAGENEQRNLKEEERLSHLITVVEKEQQKHQVGVEAPVRWEPDRREAQEVRCQALCSDFTIELWVLEQMWLLFHQVQSLQTNLRVLCRALAQYQGRRAHPLGEQQTSGDSRPAAGPNLYVPGMWPFADYRLISNIEENVQRRLDENQTENIKLSENLKNCTEVPHIVQCGGAVISSGEISSADEKTTEGFVEKLSPEESVCVNHVERGHLCKEVETLTGAKMEKEVDVSPHKSDRLEMLAELPPKKNGHRVLLHREWDGAEDDAGQSEASGGAAGNNQDKGESNVGPHALTGDLGKGLCGVALPLTLSVCQADGGSTTKRAVGQEPSQVPVPNRGLPNAPLAEIAVEGQLADPGTRKVSVEGYVEPVQGAVSEPEIVHQCECDGDGQSQSFGYKLAGKLSWLYQVARSHLHSTKQVICQIVELNHLHKSSWYKQIYMIVKHLPVCQNVHLKVTVKSATREAAQLSGSLRNYLNYIKERSHVQSALGITWSPRSSVTVSQDLQVFCQKLVEFPLCLQELQSLTPQRLLAHLNRLIPDTIPNSQLLLGIYWLHLANNWQPVPQPGCVLLFEFVICAVVCKCDLQEEESTLAILQQLQSQQIREIHVGFAGQHVRVLGATEDTIFTIYTYNKQLTQELCQALLKALSPEVLELSATHPLLRGDLMELSLDWKAHMPDLCLSSRLQLSSQFKRVLADLVYFLHGNMKEKPSLADVHLLLYTSVRVEVSPYPRPHSISCLLLTDTHVGLVQEEGVFHPVPRAFSLTPQRPHFEQIALRRLSEIRCILVGDKDSSVTMDVVFRSTGVRNQECKHQGKNKTVLPCLSHYNLFPKSEVWKLTFGCTAEAAFVINHLSAV